MKKNIFFVGILAIMLVLGMTVIGCDNGTTDSVTDSVKDSIIITSVSPNVGLIDGNETEFTIRVDYNLSTQSQGEISIMFNNGDDINVTHNDSSHTGWLTQINNGVGTHVFTTSATVKNWGSGGDFFVQAYLAPYPHGDSWRNLAISDKYVLNFD
jgi:hypothetical protein